MFNTASVGPLYRKFAEALQDTSAEHTMRCMRRHIIPVPAVSFDTRYRTLVDEIGPEWDENIKLQHLENRERLIAALAVELGPVNFIEKLDNFKAIGGVPFSVVSYHNQFLQQARSAFVQGHYYPALTAACALGERILNHLVLDLRDDFKDRVTHKKIANRSSFDNWEQVIHVLVDWGVLMPAAAEALRKLWGLRNRSLHFSAKTYVTLREDALRALQLLNTTVEAQFSAFGLQPWFIEGTPGVSFIKQDWEVVPFIKKYYLPFCPRVGIYYAYSNDSGQWMLFDYKEYEDRDVSDEEFCRLLNARDHARLAPTTLPPNDDVISFSWTDG